MSGLKASMAERNFGDNGTPPFDVGERASTQQQQQQHQQQWPQSASVLKTRSGVWGTVAASVGAARTPSMQQQQTPLPQYPSAAEGLQNANSGAHQQQLQHGVAGVRTSPLSHAAPVTRGHTSAATAPSAWRNDAGAALGRTALGALRASPAETGFRSSSNSILNEISEALSRSGVSRGPT